MTILQVGSIGSLWLWLFTFYKLIAKDLSEATSQMSSEAEEGNSLLEYNTRSSCKFNALHAL